MNPELSQAIDEMLEAVTRSLEKKSRRDQVASPAQTRRASAGRVAGGRTHGSSGLGRSGIFSTVVAYVRIGVRRYSRSILGALYRGRD